MTTDQFCLLNEMEKLSAVLQFGKLMSQETGDDQRIFIYRLESFFVSASYNLKNDHLKEITVFLQSELSGLREQLISVHPAEREFENPL